MYPISYSYRHEWSYYNSHKATEEEYERERERGREVGESNTR